MEIYGALIAIVALSVMLLIVTAIVYFGSAWLAKISKNRYPRFAYYMAVFLFYSVPTAIGNGTIFESGSLSTVALMGLVLK